MAKEKSLQSLLNLSDHPLGAALQRALSLQACNRHFQQILPKRLKNKVNILNVRDGCVIIGVSNASLMTQLHFESKELLNEIKQLPGMQRSESIQFKIMSDLSKPANDAANVTDDASNVDIVDQTNVTHSKTSSDSNSAPDYPTSSISGSTSSLEASTTQSEIHPVTDRSAKASLVTQQQVNQGKNSARRSQVTAFASEVLRQAASKVKDPQLQSALLKISKKAH